MEVNDLLYGILSACLLAGVGSLLLLLTRNHADTLGFQQKLWLSAFGVRFTVSWLLYGAGLAASIVGQGDDSGWYGGVGVKSVWEAQGIGPFDWPFALLTAYTGHHRGYAYLLAMFFSVTQMPSQLAAAALSGFCGSLGVVVVYRTARFLYSENIARRSAWWTCLFPLMIIWSAQSIKEPVVILLEAAAMYACVAIRTHGVAPRHTLLAAFAILILPIFRFYAAYITGGAVLLTLALPLFYGRLTGVISALFVSVLVLPLLSRSGALLKHEEHLEEWTSVDRISSFRAALATGEGGNSGVKTEYDMSTTRGLGLATIDGAVHLLFAPFPWEVRFGSLRMALTLPEMAVWWSLVYFGFLPGVRHAIRYRFGEVLPLLLFLIGLGLVYSITFGNVGLVYRQRAQLLPYLLIFTASGLEERRLSRNSILVHTAVRNSSPHLWS